MHNRFTWIIGMVLLMVGLCFFIEAHEGHHSFSSIAGESDFFVANSQFSSRLVSWLNHIGRFHFIFLHFPIALITMTVLAELLWIWYRNPVFDHAARFMILAAAVFGIPTAFLGFALSYGYQYEGLSLELYLWHRYLGVLTAGLAILAAILRERYVRQYSPSKVGYYISLFFLFISVSLTGAFGGSLAFGLDVW